MKVVDLWNAFNSWTPFTIIDVFATIMPDRTCPITDGAFDHILIVLKG